LAPEHVATVSEDLMNIDLQHFERFMKQREDAARAYVRGDPAPVSALATDTSPATFFGPQGSYRRGASEVKQAYERDAGMFEAGGDTRFEVLQLEAGAGLACWIGLQHATVRMRGKVEPVQMSLRVTEVFRREGDEWKLVHRHADPLAATSTDASKADAKPR
jgi:ketosteroid isomerase-like protein